MADLDPFTFHRRLLGSEPTFMQRRLYRVFPDGKRGFSCEDTDRERFVAVFVVAMVQTTPVSGKSPDVVITCPPGYESRTTKHIAWFARQVFRGLKNDTAAVKVVRESFKSILLGTQAFVDMPAEPVRWASFGFSKTDKIPKWMKDALL